MKTKPKPNSFDIHVGENLRNIRKLKAVSQGDLATAIGVSFQQIQKYEKGENRISATRLYRAAQFLETDLMKFFDGYEDKKAKNGVDAVIEDVSADMDKQTYKLLKLFKRIEDRALRKAFLKMLEKMSE